MVSLFQFWLLVGRMVWCACTAWRMATSSMSSQLVQPSHSCSGHSRTKTGQLSNDSRICLTGALAALSLHKDGAVACVTMYILLLIPITLINLIVCAYIIIAISQQSTLDMRNSGRSICLLYQLWTQGLTLFRRLGSYSI